jgi:hypothetical protein
MFLALHNDVVSLSRDPERLLDCLPAIFDWARLGIFTYNQSKPRAGELFATIPNSPDAGVWANTPLVAFLRSDFTFYNANRHQLDILDLATLLCHACLILF